MPEDIRDILNPKKIRQLRFVDRLTYHQIAALYDAPVEEIYLLAHLGDPAQVDSDALIDLAAIDDAVNDAVGHA